MRLREVRDRDWFDPVVSTKPRNVTLSVGADSLLAFVLFRHSFYNVQTANACDLSESSVCGAEVMALTGRISV